MNKQYEIMIRELFAQYGNSCVTQHCYNWDNDKAKANEIEEEKEDRVQELFALIDQREAQIKISYEENS